MVAAAAAGFRAIAPDLPGYGLSNPPSDLAQASWESLIKDLLSILDSLAISKVRLYYKVFCHDCIRSFEPYKFLQTKLSILIYLDDFDKDDEQSPLQTCKLNFLYILMILTKNDTPSSPKDSTGLGPLLKR